MNDGNSASGLARAYRRGRQHVRALNAQRSTLNAQRSTLNAQRSTLNLPLTCELVAEWSYRVTERLGMLCEARIPTPAKLALAETEANGWLAEELIYNAIDAEMPL